MTDVAIPYGAYWSTPFVRWQGSLAHLHSVKLAAWTAKRALAKRKLAVDLFDYAVLGLSVPQHQSFYGVPWLMGQMGSDKVGGPVISQACATSARVLQSVAASVREGETDVALAVTADRVSNGPHVYYPAPQGPGGTGASEDWVLDNFNCDPNTGCAMLATAENVAAEYRFGTEQQNALTLVRYAQYEEALQDDRAFLRRYMDLPFGVPDARFRKEKSALDGDEGIFPTTADGLAKLKPVTEGGTVTFGNQTHPADGNAAMVVTTPERAAELSIDDRIAIRLVSFGQARVKRAFMPMAPVPAARRALDAAGLKVDDIKAFKTHNPFIINDLVLARELGVDATRINRFGCSLVWGHPQGPTGMRSVIELIEQLVMEGGGYGLFTGCAAGDSAMSVIVSVGDRK